MGCIGLLAGGCSKRRNSKEKPACSSSCKRVRFWRRRRQTKPDEYQLVSVILAFWWAIRWAIQKRTRKPRESQKNTRVACFVTFWRFAAQKTARKAIFTLGKPPATHRRHFFIFCFPWARGVTARDGGGGRGAGLGVAWGGLAGWAWGLGWGFCGGVKKPAGGLRRVFFFGFPCFGLWGWDLGGGGQGLVIAELDYFIACPIVELFQGLHYRSDLCVVIDIGGAGYVAETAGTFGHDAE